MVVKRRNWKTKLLSVLLVAVLLLATGSGCGSGSGGAGNGSRTLLIYLCGSNLESTFGAATKNIAEMLTVQLPQNVNVMIETGGSKKWRDYDIPSDKLCRYTIRNGSLMQLQELERSNMSFESTFSDFLKYGMDAFPADNTAVILWDHGGGCVNGLIRDENYSAGSLSIDDIRSALTEAEEHHPDTHVDLLGMDACLMANFETAYALRNCADYLLASEEIEPTGGWDYQSLFSALAENKTAEELGKAVCDGFQKKYAGSDNYATLSLIDLSKIEPVSDALDHTMKSLTAKEEVTATEIRQVSESAYYARRCGANSEYNGYSNLIDMMDFAEYYDNLTDGNALTSAIKGCIAYSTVKEGDASHDGLSFFYPLNYGDRTFKTYYDQICPVPGYKSYLKQVFQNMPDNTVKIQDTSTADNGALQVDVTDDSLPYLLDKQYMLYEILEYDETEEEPSDRIKLFKMLGTDNDVETFNDGRTYRSNFRGMTPTLNGVELYYNFVGRDHDTYLFETPVRINGTPAYLRFSFVFDETEFNNGHYEIIGYWNGIEPVTGMLDKGFQALKPDDDVAVYVIEGGPAVSDDDDGDDEPEMVPKREDGYQITEEPLKGKYYLYTFYLTDIYGRPSEEQVRAIFRMTKSYDELKNNPLSDGESAGEAIAVWKES